MNALDRAVEIIGSQQRVADAVGVKSAMAVSQWYKRGVPAERVLSIYHATRGAVTPHDLRPDIYPDSAWLPPLESTADAEDAAA